MPNTPHYLLFAEASSARFPAQSWRFVLQHVESKQRMVVVDTEPHASGERLELLAVVRGLEALDGPARVTLVTKSRYVSRGIKVGLAEWRANEWCWENFGRVVPVRDHDLWQRVDRALLFHEVDCQSWHFDEASEVATEDSMSPVAEGVRVIHRRGRLAACTSTDFGGEWSSDSRLRHTNRISDLTPVSRRQLRQPDSRRTSGWLEKGKDRLARWGEAAASSVSQPMRQLVQGGV